MSQQSWEPPGLQFEQNQVGRPYHRNPDASHLDRARALDGFGLPPQSPDDDIDVPLARGFEPDHAGQRIVPIAPMYLDLHA